MALDTNVFVNNDEFSVLMVYTSPAGVVTNDVRVVPAQQTFIQEYDDYSGLGSTLSIARSDINNIEIHGKLVDTAGTIYVIQQLFGIDDDFVNVSAVSDMRISPQGMR